MAKHRFTQQTSKTSYYGHHYYTGHTRTWLHCSCGWKRELYKPHDYDKTDTMKTKHVLEAEGLM